MENDIANAVNARKSVTVSKTNINFHGWNGCGYIIADPETGAGAYMISGGTNGAWVILAALLVGILVFAAMFFPLLAAGTAFTVALLGGGFYAFVTAFATTGILVGLLGDHEVKDVLRQTVQVFLAELFLVAPFVALLSPMTILLLIALFFVAEKMTVGVRSYRKEENSLC